MATAQTYTHVSLLRPSPGSERSHPAGYFRSLARIGSTRQHDSSCESFQGDGTLLHQHMFEGNDWFLFRRTLANVLELWHSMPHIKRCSVSRIMLCWGRLKDRHLTQRCIRCCRSIVGPAVSSHGRYTEIVALHGIYSHKHEHMYKDDSRFPLSLLPWEVVWRMKSTDTYQQVLVHQRSEDNVR